MAKLLSYDARYDRLVDARFDTALSREQISAQRQCLPPVDLATERNSKLAWNKELMEKRQRLLTTLPCDPKQTELAIRTGNLGALVYYETYPLDLQTEIVDVPPADSAPKMTSFIPQAIFNLPYSSPFMSQVQFEVENRKPKMIESQAYQTVAVPDPVEDRIVVDLKLDSLVLAFDNATFRFYVGQVRTPPSRANRFHVLVMPYFIERAAALRVVRAKKPVSNVDLVRAVGQQGIEPVVVYSRFVFPLVWLDRYYLFSYLRATVEDTQ